MAVGIVPAAAVTATGVAVGFVGSDTPVGITGDGLFLDNAIKYFIPLKDNNGTYGVSYGCGATRFGTCSDTGDGGGTLTMILRFSPVSMLGVSTLDVLFEDLDLIGANDPTGFLERLRVFKGDGTAITPWITDIASTLVDGNADTQQLLTLSLGALTVDPLYLILKFKSSSTFNGTNTAEYLIATVTGPDPALPPSEVPLPGAFLLMATALIGAGGVARLRRRHSHVIAS